MNVVDRNSSSFDTSVHVTDYRAGRRRGQKRGTARCLIGVTVDCVVATHVTQSEVEGRRSNEFNEIGSWNKARKRVTSIGSGRRSTNDGCSILSDQTNGTVVDTVVSVVVDAVEVDIVEDSSCDR